MKKHTTIKMVATAFSLLASSPAMAGTLPTDAQLHQVINQVAKMEHMKVPTSNLLPHVELKNYEMIQRIAGTYNPVPFQPFTVQGPGTKAVQQGNNIFLPEYFHYEDAVDQKSLAHETYHWLNEVNHTHHDSEEEDARKLEKNWSTIQ